MTGLSQVQQAEKAISTVLRRTTEVPALGYHIGHFTQTRDLLVEALATIRGEPIKEISQRFFPAQHPIHLGAARCPFCGSPSLEIDADLDKHVFVFVHCVVCNAAGPTGENKEEAIAKFLARSYC